MFAQFNGRTVLLMYTGRTPTEHKCKQNLAAGSAWPTITQPYSLTVVIVLICINFLPIISFTEDRVQKQLDHSVIIGNYDENLTQEQKNEQSASE